MTFAGLRYFFDDSKAKLCLRPEGNNVITGFVAALAVSLDFSLRSTGYSNTA